MKKLHHMLAAFVVVFMLFSAVIPTTVLAKAPAPVVNDVLPAEVQPAPLFHANEISLSGTCQSDGTRLVTVTVHNNDGHTMTIQSTNPAGISGLGTGTTISGNQTKSGTISYSGGAGTVTITVTGIWSDGYGPRTDSASKSFSTACAQPSPTPSNTPVTPTATATPHNYTASSAQNANCAGWVRGYFIYDNGSQVGDGHIYAADSWSDPYNQESIDGGTLDITLPDGTHTNVTYAKLYEPENCITPTPTNTPVTPTETPLPTDTNTPAPTDTNTPEPTQTNTPAPDEASASISPYCLVVEGVTHTGVNIALNGATLTINGSTYGSGGFIELPTGSYSYTWTAIAGYTGSGQGSVTVSDDCKPTPTPELTNTQTPGPSDTPIPNTETPTPGCVEGCLTPTQTRTPTVTPTGTPEVTPEDPWKPRACPNGDCGAPQQEGKLLNPYYELEDIEMAGCEGCQDFYTDVDKFIKEGMSKSDAVKKAYAIAVDNEIRMTVVHVDVATVPFYVRDGDTNLQATETLDWAGDKRYIWMGFIKQDWMDQFPGTEDQMKRQYGLPFVPGGYWLRPTDKDNPLFWEMYVNFFKSNSWACSLWPGTALEKLDPVTGDRYLYKTIGVNESDVKQKLQLSGIYANTPNAGQVIDDWLANTWRPAQMMTYVRIPKP